MHSKGTVEHHTHCGKLPERLSVYLRETHHVTTDFLQNASVIHQSLDSPEMALRPKDWKKLAQKASLHHFSSKGRADVKCHPRATTKLTPYTPHTLFI